MELTKVREQRRAMRVVRLEILSEIDRLDRQRCDNCRGRIGFNTPVAQMRCGCKAAVKIREMANKMIGVAK